MQGFNIAVLGTSNAILSDGFVNYLSQLDNIGQVVSFSMGASSCIVSANMLQNINFSDYHCCIIDYMTNENIYLDTSKINSDTVFNTLAQICSDASSKNCVPINLMLPSSWLDRNTTPFIKLCEKLHQNYNIAYLDGYDLTKKLLSLSGSDSKKWYFRDEMHLTSSYCSVIADIIGSSIDNILSAKTWPRTLSEKYEVYSYVSAPSICLSKSAKTVHYDTRLISVDCIEIDLGCEAEFRLPGKKLIGMVCNSSRNFSAMDIRADHETQISFTSSYTGLAKHVITTRPIFRHIDVSNHLFKIHAIPDNNDIVERFAKYDKFRTNQRDNFGGVSIAGFVYSEGKKFYGKSVLPTSYNLTSELQIDRLKQIASFAGS